MKFAEQLKYSAFKKYSIAHFIHQEVSLLMRKYLQRRLATFSEIPTRR